jgi:hypothetical protein
MYSFVIQYVVCVRATHFCNVTLTGSGVCILRANTLKYSLTHTHTHTQTRSLTHTHKHTLMHTHSINYSHTHSHTNTHS